ncbi:MAG TPA: hypothetical protein PKU97_17780, partial [Kofleriaceae bacterium]|nr:hypothetical protein [Kofleriaceae bacterium]
MRPEHVVAGLERNVPERGLLQQHEEEFEHGAAETYDEAVAHSDLAHRAHHDDIIAAVSAIAEHRPLDLDVLSLGEQERSALEALRAAFEGRDSHNAFVYAEHRREMLEQALAALQPTLALDVSRIPELHDNYERIIAEVTELRAHLEQLEDAQDDEHMHVAVQKKDEPKDGDDGDDDGDEGDEGEQDDDKQRPASDQGLRADKPSDEA